MKRRASKTSQHKDVVLPPIVVSSIGGFTFIEVVVVMVVISIMAAITIPTYLKWLPNMRLKTAAQDLRANMQKTRFEAIQQNQSFAIVFDAANNSYFICSDSGADGDWATLGDNSKVESVELESYKSGIQFGSGAATTNATDGGGACPADGISYGAPLVFNSRGTGNAAGYVYLEHEDNTTSYALGTLVSGVIRVKKWAGTGWK
ncbi:GspH/FimT family pseudopilin [Desulfogranum marinum]|uniref:GspH/FimT family pseudopilin n=1 Tax=Desulfogranum marinum TaxID=453220 RepID=UPI0029C6097D|nr:GspH/FimT family pseudopilin [Desulfogranum marinum]